MIKDASWASALSRAKHMETIQKHTTILESIESAAKLGHYMHNFRFIQTTATDDCICACLKLIGFKVVNTGEREYRVEWPNGITEYNIN